MKKIFLIISLLFAVTNLMAEPIGEKRAREIATEFLSQKMTRATISNLQLEWAGSNINGVTRASNNTDDSLMYIYNSAESKSFVIIGGDTNADFVLAYSLNNTFDMENMADGAKAILSAWCRQIEDARKKNTPININRHSTRTNNAILYQTANWDQGEPYNRETPIINGQRSATGCAATAMAIICHYNKWPNNGVGTTPEYTYTDSYDNQTHTIPANELGSTYDYDNMLMSYEGNYTQAQGDAIAALMKDMGTSIEMKYHPKGSAAYDMNVATALSKYFGYSKKTSVVYGSNYSYDEWTDTLRENLSTYGPTLFNGVSYDGGGHAFVLDGFDEMDRFHFNYGWSGIDNGYYHLPSAEYYAQQSAILYLTPDREGASQYSDNLTLLYSDCPGIYTGLTSYSQGVEIYCAYGNIMNVGATTFNGYIKLVLCDKQGNWKQELITKYLYLGQQSVDNIQYATFTLTDPLSVGDRIRLYYKGEYSSDWQWARGYSADVVDELILIASPEDIANYLTLKYDKSNEVLSLLNKLAMKIDIYYHYDDYLGASDETTALQPYSIKIPSGDTYRIELSLGGEPYKLILKL